MQPLPSTRARLLVPPDRFGDELRLPLSGMEAAQSTIAAQKRQHGARIHEKPFPLSAGSTAEQPV